MSYNEIIKKIIDENKKYFHVFESIISSLSFNLIYLFLVGMVIFTDELDLTTKFFGITIGLGIVTFLTETITCKIPTINKGDFNKMKYNFKKTLKSEHIYSQKKINNLNEIAKKEYFNNAYYEKESIIKILFTVFESVILLIITELQLNSENETKEQLAEKYVLYGLFLLLFNILPIYPFDGFHQHHFEAIWF